MSKRQKAATAKHSSFRPKIISIPQELKETTSKLREMMLNFCISYWSYHCDMYMRGLRRNDYSLYTFSFFDNRWRPIQESMDTYDLLALSTVCFNGKLAYGLVTSLKDYFDGMLVQDNKLLPHNPSWYVASYVRETLAEQYKIKNGIYCGCKFGYLYEKIIIKKSIVNQFLYFTHKAINSYLIHNKIDPGDRFIPPSLSKEYIGMLEFLPKLYCIWANNDFVMHNIMTFRVRYDKREENDDQWPRIFAPCFTFHSTNEELQKILNLEPVKQVAERMKQALTDEILRQIQLNASRLGKEITL